MGKTGIQRRILLLLLSAGLVTFFGLSAISLINIYDDRANALHSGSAMGEKAASFSEEFTIREAKERLAAVSTEKAGRIELIVGDILLDASNIAKTMERILARQNVYTSRQLTTPTEKFIPGNRAYIYYNKGVRQQMTADPYLAREVGVEANIAESLETISRRYKTDTSCYIASENGYLIWSDGLSDGNELAEFPDVYLNNEFQSQIRPWYIAAKDAGHPVVTDVYVAAEGDSEITCAAPYYYSDGSFAGVAGISTPLDSLYSLIQEKSMGDDSINFALDENGCVAVSSQTAGSFAVSKTQEDLRMSAEPSIANAAKAMTQGEKGVVQINVDGEEYYLAYAPMPSLGWSFGTLVKHASVIAPAVEIRHTVITEVQQFASSMDKLFWQNLLRMVVLLVIILVIIVLVSRRAAKHFVEPILALNDGVKDIAKGNLEKKLFIKTGDEIEGLADCINNMTDELKTYMENLAKATADKEHIATELSLAQGIQESMLPHIFPKFSANPHYDLFAVMEPAREVGGDFYDFYMIDEDHLAITIADVSGKGIPASLFMVISKTILKNSALSGERPINISRFVQHANEQLCENNEKMMFVTVFYGVLNIQTGEFSYVNAGHNYPLLGHTADGITTWQYLKEKKKQFALGVMEGRTYEEKHLTLRPGDMLFIYTDGVTEAMNEKGALYSEEKLEDTLKNYGHPEADAKTILASVRANIKQYVGKAEQSDDITMMGIRYLG